MAHFISAVLLRGPFDRPEAAAYGFRPIPLAGAITLFPLDANLCDHLKESLGILGGVSDRPRMNRLVIHHLMRHLAREPLFAVIETDYFGGRGDQAAAAYRGGSEVMAPEVGAVGPINEALRLLGVQATAGRDEFDTVGLHRFRSFDELLGDSDE